MIRMVKLINLQLKRKKLEVLTGGAQLPLLLLPAGCLCCTGRCRGCSGRWDDRGTPGRRSRSGHRTARAGARPPGEPCATAGHSSSFRVERRIKITKAGLSSPEVKQHSRKVWFYHTRPKGQGWTISLSVSAWGSAAAAFRCCRNLETAHHQSQKEAVRCDVQGVEITRALLNMGSGGVTTRYQRYKPQSIHVWKLSHYTKHLKTKLKIF